MNIYKLSQEFTYSQAPMLWMFHKCCVILETFEKLDIKYSQMREYLALFSGVNCNILK